MLFTDDLRSVQVLEIEIHFAFYPYQPHLIESPCTRKSHSEMNVKGGALEVPNCENTYFYCSAICTDIYDASASPAHT